jgi:hypothetical protein
MGTGSRLPLALSPLLRLSADFSVSSACAATCTPTLQRRRCPNLNTWCHCLTHPVPLAIRRLPCPPRPILDLHILATPLRCHCTTACVRRSVRDSACGALTNTCRCACHPHDHSLPPLLLPPSLVPPSLPHRSRRPLLSSFPISVLTCFFLSPPSPSRPVPSRPVPPLLADPPRNRAPAPMDPLCGCYPRTPRTRGHVLQAYMELGFRRARCDSG